jgi:hypothetical protein
MKITLLALFLYANLNSFAQTKSIAKKVMDLKMPTKEESGEFPGTRGASVVWHPKEKKYYAAMSGNIKYPLAVFDAKGKRLSKNDLTCQVDVRGLWYNKYTNNIEGNTYNKGGWFKYVLNKMGMASETAPIVEGMHQPDDQSVGAFDWINKLVLFLDKSFVINYYNNGKEEDNGEEGFDMRIIHWGQTAEQGAAADEDIMKSPEGYNLTSLLFTGIKGKELGFLNITKKQIELYDNNSGFITHIITLPQTATVEASFSFAYTNGMYWLFNIDKRTWEGYK